MNLSDFKNYLLLNCGSPASVQCHMKRLVNFFKQYDEFTQENVNKFLIDKKEKLETTSFNIYLNALKWYAKFLKVELEFPLYQRIDVRVKDYCTKEEIQDIIIKLPVIFENYQKIQILLSLMLETGCRPREIKELKRSNFDLERNNLIIKNTKTHKDRLPPLSNQLCDSIYRYFQQEGEKINAFNITEQGLGYIFRTIKQRLNLTKEFTPYTLRRSYAHNMIEKGLKLTSLKCGMNHRNINTTLGYLNVTEEQAYKEIRKILNQK